jgi:hypothetical protein
MYSCNAVGKTCYTKCRSCYTGYDRKKSRIWETNKFKTKEDMANVFFISGKYTVHRFKSTTECRFTSSCFEQNITQVVALNVDTLK